MNQNPNDGPQSPVYEIDSFLMVGQSNMCGRGYIEEVEPIVNPDCFMLRNGRWLEMSEPINVDRPVRDAQYKSGVCLAASFADSYARTFGRKIGLIPCADGGTRADEWMPGDVLFDHAVMQAGLARRSSELKGILWHQGESNARTGDLSGYESELYFVLKQFRTALGRPDLPIVVGEISRSITAPWWVPNDHAFDDINRIIRTVAADLGNCAVVSVDGLEIQKDGLHFSAKALRTLGLRYFDAYRQLIGGSRSA